MWVALCAAILMLGSAVRVGADDKKYLFEDRLIVGQRRSIEVKREYSEKSGLKVGEETVAATERTFWTEGLTHEWFMELHANGAPKRVMRTYEKLKRESQTVTTTKYTDPIKSPRAEITDPRKGGIYVIGIDEKGERKVEGETPNLIWEHDKKRVKAPLEMDILPHKEVQVGETWTIAGGQCEILYDCEDSLIDKTDPEPFESGELTVSFASFGKADSGIVASLRIEGVLKYHLKKKAAYGDEIVTDILTEATVKGEATIDLATGHMLHRLLEVSFTRSGKKDGTETAGTATLRDERTYRTAFIFEAAPENGADDIPVGPVKEMQTFKLDKVAPGHILLADNRPDGGRVIVFDPATKKRVKTLCVLPAGKNADHLSLAPTRDRVAFSSTINNEISVSPWNVFVLETATGKLNQVTPSWATGDGLAQPLKSSSATVTGRLEFYDDYERQVRTDDISSEVQLDQSTCHIAAGSAFKLENAPSGILLLRVKAKVPKPRHGVPSGVSVYARDASVVTLVTVKAGETTDVGTLRLNLGAVDMVYCNSTWGKAGLMGVLHSSGMAWTAGYPARTWALDTKPTLADWPAGFAFDSKGERLAYTSWGSGRNRFNIVDPVTRKAVSSTDLDKEGAEIVFDSRMTWCAEDMVLSGAMARCRYEFGTDAPALVTASVGKGAARVLKTLPEWSGRSIRDITVRDDGKLVFIVVTGKLPTTSDERGELYCWEAATDTMTRLTNFKHVLSVSNTGR
jgi:hypothetical protein